MDRSETDMRLLAGRTYGQETTCGRKVDYKSEASADKAAKGMMAKGRKDLEAYPCAFCDGWHIGRKMTDKERNTFKGDVNVKN